MSRRDTIIFAVLINTGLLIILFATAMKSDGPSSTTIAQNTPQQAEQVTQQDQIEDIITTSDGGDEVDQLLTQLSSKTYIQQDAKDVKKVEVLATDSTPSIKKTGDFVEITVKRGDVLERIARANGVTVEEIMKQNNLLDSHLNIGQVLRVPIRKTSKAVAQQESSRQQDADGSYYTVRSGDNPWVIALKHRINVQDLLKLNNLDEEKARRLKPGDRLRVR